MTMVTKNELQELCSAKMNSVVDKMLKCPLSFAQCYLTRYIGQHLENFYFKFVGKFLIER